MFRGGRAGGRTDGRTDMCQCLWVHDPHHPEGADHPAVLYSNYAFIAAAVCLCVHGVCMSTAAVVPAAAMMVFVYTASMAYHLQPSSAPLRVLDWTVALATFGMGMWSRGVAGLARGWCDVLFGVAAGTWLLSCYYVRDRRGKGYIVWHSAMHVSFACLYWALGIMLPPPSPPSLDWAA
jgi:hypothetical protein